MLSISIRRRCVGLISVLLAASLALAVVPALPAEAAVAAPEKEMVRRHNNQRRVHGRRYLWLSPSLSRKAERHAVRMARRGYIFHSKCLSCKFEGYNWSVGGENVGVGSTIRSLHWAFMDSPPHRRNILYREYRYIGVGAVKARGRLWVTVLFMG